MARRRRVGLSELQQEVRLLGDTYPRLAEDDLFVTWFVFAYITGARQEAVDSLTGKSGEKSVDALYIDDNSRLVTLVQGKYRKSLMQSAESRDAVMGFANVAEVLAGPLQGFRDFTDTLEGNARSKLEEARERVLRRSYRLTLHYATLGRCSKSLKDEARRRVRAISIPAQQRPRMTVLDGDAILGILEDYLDGVAPPVPLLELAVEGRPEEQFDPDSGIASWIFSMNGHDIGSLFDDAGKKLFARNIRGFLGDTKINQSMRQTLNREPESFWYLNNGVTLVCDRAEFESSGGHERLTVHNPQIINGQQTTRVLASVPRQSAKASVSVRVISVPRGAGDHDFKIYDQLVARIVAATNSQNQIKASDLRANDRLQVTLERELQKLGYRYERKREAASERAALSSQYEWRLSKEDLAKAVSGCQSAIRLRTIGREALFEDEHYRGIFNHHPKYLLCCWWLSEVMNWLAWGNAERQWSKFVVLHWLWQDLSNDILARRDAFLDILEHSATDHSYVPLERAAKHAFAGAVRFYRADRGRGKDRIELSPFFKRQNVYDEFLRSWRSQKNPYGPRYRQAAREFRSELKTR